MKHPSTRAERRHVRSVWINRRVFIATHIWYTGNGGWKPTPGRYAKFNLNCGCKSCHWNKYYTEKRRRRRALDAEIEINLASWGFASSDLTLS